VLKGLPTGYNKDLQEDKEAFLTAFQNVRETLSVLRLTVRTAQLNGERMQEAASDSFMGATDLADYLVLRGMPFRKAHEVVAQAVRGALNEGKQLSEMKLADFSPEFSNLPADYLLPSNIVARKDKSFTRPDSLK
jgi:argininosuccinate lyase